MTEATEDKKSALTEKILSIEGQGSDGMQIKYTGGYQGHNEPIIGKIYTCFAVQFSLVKDEPHAYISTVEQSTAGKEDPFPFPLNCFEIVNSDIPSDWVMGYIKEFKTWVLGFPEITKYDYFLKAHDYDLGAEELAIFRKYRDSYANENDRNHNGA